MPGTKLLLGMGRLAVMSLIALSMATSAHAQVGKPTKVEQKLLFNNIFEGVPSEALVAIAQDETGFLWFGTFGGLARYDGYEFKPYSSKTHKGIPKDFTVVALAADATGLWIGTSNEGLLRLEFATDKVETVQGLASSVIQALAIDASGQVWIGSDKGINILNPAGGEPKLLQASETETENFISSNDVTALLVSSTGEIWAGTNGNGLSRISADQSKIEEYHDDFANDPQPPESEKELALAGDRVLSLFEDESGAIWVGTYTGLTRLDLKAKSSKHYFRKKGTQEPEWVTSMTMGQDEALWIGTRTSGIIRLEPKTGKTTNYRDDPEDPNSIINVYVRSAFSDRTGVLWFGYSANGVSKTNLLRQEFGHYKTKPGLSFYEDGKDLWVGSTGEGLRKINIDTGEVEYLLEDELTPTWLMQIVPAKEGKLWLGTTDKGIYQLDPASNQAIQYDDIGSASVILPEGDNLWVATLGAGVQFYDAVSDSFVPVATQTDVENKSLSNDVVYALHRDPSNPKIFWVGTGEGLDRLDTTDNTITQFHHDDGDPKSLCHDHVTDIFESKGIFWIATWGGGICKFSPTSKEFTSYNTENGKLPNDVIYRILEDDTGNLWMSSNKGIIRFSPELETSVAFGESDGLQRDEFGQGSGYAGKSGRFYFGGPGGFNAFFPARIKRDDTAPQLSFTKFEKVGKEKLLPKTIELTYQDSIFSVEFAALSFADPGRNRYRFRLKGYHDWIETQRRYASYSALPAGDYVFEVQGSNHHGKWNEEGIKLNVSMAPAPWFTWWAFVAYGGLVIGAVLLWIQRNKRKLRDLTQSHRLNELEKEIELTSAVQDGFLPDSPSIDEGLFKLEGYYKPAAQCSGDWWWYEKREDTYFIVVADVTGHGAGPAMVTAAVAASFRSIAHLISDEDRIKEINAEVCRISDNKYNMTMTAMEINPTTGAYKLYFAGGLPALSLIPGGRPKSHLSSGTPLGTKDLRVGMVEGQLIPGERLLLMTDGIPEVEISKKKLYGVRRLSKVYTESATYHPADSIKHIVNKVSEVQVGAQDDDWTMVIVEWGRAA